MKRLFADTSYYIALLNAADAHHGAAIEVSRQGPVELVTHGWILTEVADALSDSRNRQLFVELHKELREDSRSIIISANETLFDRGIALYSKRLDKNWSLTDCISFVVMEDFGLGDALTADHHFEQAGFRALMCKSLESEN